MLNNTIVQIVFALQIFSVSFYYVRLWINQKVAFVNMSDSINQEQKNFMVTGLKQRKLINNIVLIMGVIFLIVSFILSLSQQNMLYVILLYSGIQLVQYRLDRKWYYDHMLSKLVVKSSNKRSTSLQARQLKDFVSPVQFLIAMVSYIVIAVTCIYFVSNQIGVNKVVKIYLLMLLNTVMFVCYFWQIYQAVYAKPKNFQLEYSLRLVRIKKRITKLLYVLITYNVFILILLVFQIVQLSALSVIVLTSLFFQAVLLPKKLKYEKEV